MVGKFWTSTAASIFPSYLGFSRSNAGVGNYQRSFGNNVSCIKD